MWTPLVVLVACISQYNAAVAPLPPIVAFSMGATNHSLLTKGETLQYNKDLLNVGTSVERGVFTVKTPGLYAFHFFALTRTSGELWIDLVLNGETIASLYGYTANSYSDAGNSVILNLIQGDVVSVKARDQYQNSLFGAADQVYSTFTGVLLDSGSYEDSLLNRDVPVGFSVSLSKNVTLQTGQVVPYDVPITYRNTSDFVFHLDSESFIATNDGIYIFHFYGLAYGNQEVYLELYHNSQYVVSLYGYTASYFADAGNTVILHLRKGDHVNVRSGNDGVGLYGSPTEKYTTFSGALLALTHPAVGNTHTGVEEIAFSVGLHKVLNATADEKVIYDRLFINAGRAFDMSTGTFTAPVDGFYAFHYHGLSETGQEIWLELYRNYEYEDSLYAYDPNSYASGGNAAVMELHAGDEIFINSQGWSVLYGTTDQVYCTFSGYLIAPIFNEHTVVGR